MVPTSARQWHVAGTSGFQDLKLQEAPIPKVGELDVLVQFKYVSLNYRDLLISKVSTTQCLYKPLAYPHLL